MKCDRSLHVQPFDKTRFYLKSKEETKLWITELACKDLKYIQFVLLPPLFVRKEIELDCIISLPILIAR